jgi:hypothetical protein
VIRAIRLVLFVGCHLSFFPSEKWSPGNSDVKHLEPNPTED